MGLLREVRLELSYMTFALGLLLSVFAILNYFFRGSLPGALEDLLRDIGNWIVWFVAAGPLLGLAGGWYFIDTIRKRREFEKLINVPSKAMFVRNQDRLERLAWYLPSEYARRLDERKRKWKIKG